MATSWTDFLPRGYFSKISKELYFMPLSDIIVLREKKIIKRDHSYTGVNDKKRLKEDVWHLDVIIEAYNKFNNLKS